MTAIYRTSPKITFPFPMINPDGTALDGCIGAQLLFYSKEAAEQWCRTHSPDGTVEQCFEYTTAPTPTQ